MRARPSASGVTVAVNTSADSGPMVICGCACTVAATVTPLAEGRARIATALADGRSLAYTLAGTLEAGPEDGGPRTYTIKRTSALTPVPGLPGVLR